MPPPMNFFAQNPAAMMGGSQANNAMNTLFKTSLCKHFEQSGRCNIGAKCHFAHGKHEMRGKEDVSIGDNVYLDLIGATEGGPHEDAEHSIQQLQNSKVQVL